MDWTDEDAKYLRTYKSIVDCDDVKIKEQVKRKLVTNKYIAHALHNTALENDDANPEDYFGVNIFPYYIIDATQHDVQNFLCYEVSYEELDRYNSSVKMLQIIFYILCYQKDVVDEETSIARHDLLAALVIDQFNYTNIFGAKVQLVSDKASVVDTHYAARTLVFEQITDNNLVKTRDKVSRLANKDIVY